MKRKVQSTRMTPMTWDDYPDADPFEAEDERLWDLYHDANADARFDCNRLQALDAQALGEVR